MLMSSQIGCYFKHKGEKYNKIFTRRSKIHRGMYIERAKVYRTYEEK